MPFLNLFFVFVFFFIQEIVMVFRGTVLKRIFHRVLECLADSGLRNECATREFMPAFFALPNSRSDSANGRKIAFCASVRTFCALFKIGDELSVSSAVSDAESTGGSGNFTFT